MLFKWKYIFVNTLNLVLYVSYLFFITTIITDELHKQFNTWVETKIQYRVVSLANEISARHLQSEVEELARKYSDRLFEKEPLFAVPGESVIGNANPQHLKMPGEFVEKIMMVEATAYWTHDPIDAWGEGIAADGTPAIAYKTCAVDPEVIPLGSEIYVPTIGWLRCNDTGNAINGRIIDIAMPSREAAWNWGRRIVQIRVRKRVK